MAKDKKQFDLTKGSSREFNTTKGSSRKFDLVKETDEPVAAPAQPEPQKPASAADTTPAETKGGMKWIWIAVAVVVIALLAWLLIPKSDSKEAAGQEETTEAVAAESAAPQESSVNDEAQAAEPADEAEAEPEQTVPAQPEQNAAAEPQSAPVAQPAVAPAAEVTDDVEAEAQKVIRGAYGDGQVRKDRLGSKYSEVQRRVNELKRQGAF